MKRDCQVDMHVHTDASDGTWSTEDLLELIIKKDIKLFSITDHDTIENCIRMLHTVPEDIKYVVGLKFHLHTIMKSIILLLMILTIKIQN